MEREHRGVILGACRHASDAQTGGQVQVWLTPRLTLTPLQVVLVFEFQLAHAGCSNRLTHLLNDAANDAAAASPSGCSCCYLS